MVDDDKKKKSNEFQRAPAGAGGAVHVEQVNNKQRRK
jgi:hypothetical protein